MDFLTLGIKDLIDIAFVWLLIYQILRLFKGTRASYMFLGLIVILILAVTAQFLNLEGLSWIISLFETIGLVALIIVFQPEIRRALAALGRNPAIRSIFKIEEEVLIPEIIKAIFTLRDRGLGGIIVIERKMSLREFIEDSGVHIDARISAPLIASIFTPPSPLHDGAVILKEGRIIAARVLLPLSNAPGLDPSLGTRHRACVGVTEVSDAIAIVISEETRAVRLAVGGSLTPPTTKDNVAKLLIDYLEPTKEGKEYGP